MSREPCEMLQKSFWASEEYGGNVACLCHSGKEEIDLLEGLSLGAGLVK